MRIRLLGPFEVQVAGAPVDVPGRQRTLLAALALSPDRPVSVDALAAAIWGDELPHHVKGSVQTVVMRLRQVVGVAAIATGPDGYRLVAAETDVDAFHWLLDHAKAAAGTDAERTLLAGAVALWRGAPLHGVASTALRALHVPPLEERFLAAVERRANLDLAAGGGTELCTELRALTDRFPLREPLWEQLIRALASAGRNAEALSAYARCRDLLADELGVEPNARLRQLHLDLLRAADEPAPAPAIPQPLTRLFGRDDEVTALVDALTEGPNRLITLIGVAGTGKTRLALATAHAAAKRGLATWWVPLSPVPTVERVLPAIAHAVAACEVSVAGLGQRFGGRPVLVVVDNLEHLAGVGEVLADLLTRLPTLRVLATSRAPAGVAGEQEWLVAPLPVPAAEPGSPDEVATVASVALFVDRVRAATPSFELTEDVRAAVVDICRHLHGLPLGLELAAGQWRVRGAEVAALIREAPLDLRAIGNQRFDTLRDAIAASYVLLDDDAKDILCRLAVFQGGWTYELAAFATTGDGLLTRLDRLVSLGLVHIADTAAGRRFAMVPAIQAFAAAQAGERGVVDAAAAAHATAVWLWVDLIEERLRGAGREPALVAIDAERANLLAAHRWFADHDPNAGLALISALGKYWRARGREDEALACFASFLGLATDLGQVGEALAEAAALDVSIHDPNDAAALAGRALSECRRLGDRRGQVHALTVLAYMTRESRGLTAAIEYHRTAAEVAEVGDDPLLLGRVLAHLAGPLADQGCYDDAEDLLKRAVDIATEHDHPFVLFDALLCQTEIRRRHDDLAGATYSLERARRLFGRTGDIANQTFWHAQAAVIAASEGDLATAGAQVAKALGLTRGRDVRNRCACCASWARGELLSRSGDQDGAAEAFRQALAEDTLSRADRLVEVLTGLAGNTTGAEVAAHALAAADWLRDRDQLCLPVPLATQFGAIRARWAAVAGEPAWHAMLGHAETRCAENITAVLDDLAARDGGLVVLRG